MRFSAIATSYQSNQIDAVSRRTPRSSRPKKLHLHDRERRLDIARAADRSPDGLIVLFAVWSANAFAVARMPRSRKTAGPPQELHVRKLPTGL
jgi:hypothetical protein